ncbi:MAG: sulfotransferase [Hymenobacteraceae bacterium]|nr:sulfotransferase [Hymenobacteraceae bacterium]
MPTVEYIIAGYERGGTTLLSDLFRANGFESGFECGVLLGKDPSEMPNFKAYWDMLLDGWSISEETRKKAISGDFKNFYDVLCSNAFPNFKGSFFDKTPRYMQNLGQCLHRAPFLKGAAIIHRDPRAFFVSATKRLSPKKSISAGIRENFTHLKSHYMSYFFGSIGHIEQANVLFVPFEEIVSREDAWLKTLGYFTIGTPFIKRSGKPRFNNVTSSKMDLGKIIEFDELVPPELQQNILEATRLASPFFAGPIERARYGELWEETFETAKKRLIQFELPAVGMDIDGTYFEPLTYLIRYPDILKSGINPAEHFRKAGRREKRIPA